ncbi:MAG: hypothetical protein JO182_19465 [Acidobacteriaceae bacterium]|nr:hypothetical protein [Acidobacteriaceae bacterium]MBV9227301.1 hypothetical protein [Acidobacteriaceae bacterium]MBV9676748.1 hypothetical protein [Acidobacteriaceae bacterium]MBV9939046.1 hypothetical protein [Acidobacteriaceae bacterium]
MSHLWQLNLIFFAFVTTAAAQDTSVSTTAGTQGGASAIWIFANLSFTGMRAHAKGSTVWKVVTFIFGFPGTLLTLLVVPSGSERAYGIDLPRKR